MLRQMRASSRTWLGKIVAIFFFTLIAISFAIWGIGDMFRGGASQTVATVGDTTITAEQARSAFQTQLQQLSQRTRQVITPAEAMQVGLDNQVLQTLVTEAALDQRTRELGIVVSDELVARAIVEDPNFQDAGGRFSRDLFQRTLAFNNLTEAGYVALQRQALARALYAGTLSADFSAPLAAQEALHRYGAERRTVSYFVLGAGQAGEIAEPAEADLAAFFSQNSTRYRAPEYRAATVLVISPAEIADPSAITEDEARARYAQVAETRFGTPERRDVQQIPFPSVEEAAAAAERVRSGATSFDALAAERGVAPDVLNLGPMRRNDFVDPIVAQAAFALPEGGVSDPVQGRFGVSLVRVRGVEPSRTQPFEEIAQTLRTEIALEQASRRINTVYDEIEDMRASARPLAEIAAARGLAAATIEAVDRSGLDPQGRPLTGLPETSTLVREIFASDIGVDDRAIRLPDGGYMWFAVTDVRSARDRDIAEVRDRVVADWRAERLAQNLAERGRALAARVEAGETMEAVAAEAGVPLQTASNLARSQGQGDITPTASARIFATPVGRAESASLDAGRRVVFRVQSASAPPYLTTTPQAETIASRLEADMGGDIFAQVVAQIESEIGVNINTGAFREAIGGGL